MRPIITAAVLLSCLAHAAPAQSNPAPAPHADTVDVLRYTPPRVYQGQAVVRVHTTTRAQLDAVLDLARDVWSERTGVGELDIAVDRDDLARLQGLGVEPAMLIDDLQAHADQGWARIVARARLERESGAGFQRGGTVHDESWFANYRQLDEIRAYTDNIAQLRPDLASKSVIGQSWEGRDMEAISITAPDAPGNAGDDRPVVYIFSTVHAREWIAPMTTCYFASRLVSDYGTDTRVTEMLDHARVVIVPLGNPDGYVYSWTHQRLWRNTRRPTGNGTYGVNINRNWGYEWGNEGSSPNPGNTNYRGEEPFSEPETKALRDVALAFGDQLVADIEYHSYSQLILWPFGYAEGNVTPEPDASGLNQLGEAMAHAIRGTPGASYKSQQAVDLYPAAGNSPDWFYGALGVTSYLIELRPMEPDFDPPPSTILPCAKENYEALKLYVERTTRPIRIWGERTDQIVANSARPLTARVISLLPDGQPVPVMLNTRVGQSGPFIQTPMTPEITPDGDLLIGSLPLIPCGQQVQYYYSTDYSTDADSGNGQTITFPPNGEAEPFSALAVEQVAIVNDPLETDTGWIVGSPIDTATEGIWTRMDPQGTAAQPENDHSEEGSICWVTDGHAGVDADDGDVDNGFTSLISPRFDATGAVDDLGFSFWYWHTTAGANPDPLSVRLSNNDGETWTTIAFLQGENNQWTEAHFGIAGFIEPTDRMRVRFQAIDLNNDNTMEAAIDDFRVQYIGCPSRSADFNADGVINFFDVSAYLQAYYAKDPAADFNGDGVWNFFDVAGFLAVYHEG